MDNIVKASNEEKINELCEEYGEDSVIEAISKLSNIDKNIISYSVGINGFSKKSVKEISEIMNMKANNVSYRCFNAFKRLKTLLDDRNLRAELKLKKLYLSHNKDIVNNVFNSLSEEKKIIIENYYGFNGKKSLSAKEISELFGVSKCIVNNMANKFVDKINKIESEDGEYKYQNRSKRLYSLQEKYGSEKVRVAIKMLSEKCRNTINFYYGINGEVKTIKEIGEILNMDPNNASSTLYNALNNIEEVVNQVNEDAINFASKYGEDEVKNYISTLDYNEKEIMNLYFGYENGISMKPDQIGYFLDKDAREVRFVINKVLYGIEKDYFDKNFKRDNKLFELQEKYGIEKVRNLIYKLNDKRKDMLKFYYGTGSKRKEIHEICKIYNVDVKQIEDIVKNTVNELEFELKSSVFDKRIKKLIQLFNKHGKDNVLFVINKIKSPNKDIFVMYHGLDNNECKSIKEISDILNISYEKVENSIYYCRNRIVEVLQAKLEEKRRNHFNEFVKVKDKELFIKVLSELNEKDTVLIRMYYGIGTSLLSIDEICDRLNLDKENVNERLFKEIELVNSRCLSRV